MQIFLLDVDASLCSTLSVSQSVSQSVPLRLVRPQRCIRISSILDGLGSHTLVDRVGVSRGIYSIHRSGWGGHPSMVPQYTKDHLKSILSLIYWHAVRGCPPLPSGLMKYSPRAMSIFSPRIHQCIVFKQDLIMNYNLDRQIVLPS